MINYLPQLINVIVNNFGSTSVVSLVQNSNDKLSTKIILDNATRTIDEIETIVLCVIAIMLILIIMLLTSLIVNDSKKLSGVLKALGIRDHTNIVSFLSIYAPTIIVGGLLSIPLAIAVVSLFNSIIFNTLGIYILTNIKW
jgi:ABC-type lipoprotein release transport system permease subunit